MRDWLRVALRPDVVKTATVVASIVGTILIVINHGDAIVRGELGAARLLRIGLTVVIPYLVSTVSSVSAIRRTTLPALGRPGAGER